MMKLSVDRYEDVEEAINQEIGEVASAFNEALQSLIIARSKGSHEVPASYVYLHQKQAVYNAVAGILYSHDVIDLEFRLSMIHDLAERGSTFHMVPTVPSAKESQMAFWRDILNFFSEEEEEWVTFTSPVLR